RTGKLVRALLTDRPAFAAEPTADRLQLVQELCVLVGSGRDSAEAGAVLDALAKRVARRGTSFPTFLKSLPGHEKQTTKLLAAATAPAADPKASDDERAAAARLLAHAPWEAAGPVLTKLAASDETPTPVRLAAIRSLAAHPRPEVAGLL